MTPQKRHAEHVGAVDKAELKRGIDKRAFEQWRKEKQQEKRK